MTWMIWGIPHFRKLPYHQHVDDDMEKRYDFFLLISSDPKGKNHRGWFSGGWWIERTLLRDALWQDERQEADQAETGCVLLGE